MSIRDYYSLTTLERSSLINQSDLIRWRNYKNEFSNVQNFKNSKIFHSLNFSFHGRGSIKAKHSRVIFQVEFKSWKRRKNTVIFLKIQNFTDSKIMSQNLWFINHHETGLVEKMFVIIILGSNNLK